MYTGECCSPVGIVHVLLSDFVRLGVNIDRVLRLGGHELGPDYAALLTNLFKIFTLIIPIIPIRLSFTSDTGSFFKCQTDSTKSRFSVAYSFSRKERKWSLPAGSLSNSQPAIKLMILIIQTASWELFASTLNHLQLVARKRSTQSLDILKSYYEMEKWLRLERAQSGANSWIKFG